MVGRAGPAPSRRPARPAVASAPRSGRSPPTRSPRSPPATFACFGPGFERADAHQRTPSLPGRPHAPDRRSDRLRSAPAALGTRLSARRDRRAGRRLVLRRPFQQRSLHAGNADGRGGGAGPAVPHDGAGLHHRARRLGLPPGAGRGLQVRLPRPGDPRPAAPRQLRGLHRGGRRRRPAGDLWRAAGAVGRVQGVLLPALRPQAGAGLAALRSGDLSRDPRRAADRPPEGDVRGDYRALLACAWGRPSEAVRLDVRGLRQPAPRAAPARACPITSCRGSISVDCRPGRPTDGGRLVGRVRRPAGGMVFRGQRQSDDAVRRPRRGAAAGLRLARLLYGVRAVRRPQVPQSRRRQRRSSTRR